MDQCAALSTARIFMPKDLRQSDQRLAAVKAIAEVQRRFAARNAPLPLLDPVKDLKVDAARLEKSAQRLEAAMKAVEENALLAAQGAQAAAGQEGGKKGGVKGASMDL